MNEYVMGRAYPVLILIIVAGASFGAGVTWSEGHYIAMSSFMLVAVILLACLIYHMNGCRVTVVGDDGNVFPGDGMRKHEYGLPDTPHEVQVRHGQNR